MDGLARGGQLPERVGRALDVPGERDRGEGGDLRRGDLLLRRRKHTGRDHALIGRLLPIVALDDRPCHAVLAEKLADGREEVELEPQQDIQPAQDGKGRPRRVPIAAKRRRTESQLRCSTQA